MALTIISRAFQPNDSIPTRHTCEGDDVSPELSWTHVPDGAQSLALIVDDPDASDPQNPKTTWVHWVLYALDTVLPDLGTPTKAELEKAMDEHVLAHAELVGTYQKSG